MELQVQRGEAGVAGVRKVFELGPVVKDLVPPTDLSSICPPGGKDDVAGHLVVKRLNIVDARKLRDNNFVMLFDSSRNGLVSPHYLLIFALKLNGLS